MITVVSNAQFRYLGLGLGLGLVLLIVVILSVLSQQSWLDANYVPVGQTRVPIDPNEYKGLWYEIGKYPNNFQRDCAQSIAEYSLDDENGYIVVKNTCIGEGSRTLRVATGKAFGTSQPGQLAVSFFPGFYGQYGILYREPTISVVGSSDRQYLWILARSPSIDQTTLSRVMEEVQKLGYDTSRIVFGAPNVA